MATSGVDTVTAELFYTKKRPTPLQTVKLYAQANIDGETVQVPVIPCDEYEQAFAWHHFVPSEAFLFRGQPGGGGKPANAKPKKKQK